MLVGLAHLLIRYCGTADTAQRIKSADRADGLCCFVGVEVLKGCWASTLLGSLPVGQKTGDNFMLIQDSLANVVILGQEMTQRRNWPNGEVGSHLHRLFRRVASPQVIIG